MTFDRATANWIRSAWPFLTSADPIPHLTHPDMHAYTHTHTRTHTPDTQPTKTPALDLQRKQPSRFPLGAYDSLNCDGHPPGPGGHRQHVAPSSRRLRCAHLQPTQPG